MGPNGVSLVALIDGKNARTARAFAGIRRRAATGNTYALPPRCFLARSANFKVRGPGCTVGGKWKCVQRARPRGPVVGVQRCAAAVEQFWYCNGQPGPRM